MKGTYGYMAPEQVSGDPVTPRTDVYAGCLVLRELLLGRPAFDEGLPELELLKSMLDPRLAPIDTLRRGIPRKLAYALDRGLSRDPRDRTVSTGEMLEILRSFVDMELAHAELVARLERVRPRLVSSSPSPQSQEFPTPRAMTIASVESLAPLERVSPPPRAFPATARSLTAVGALTFVVVFGLVSVTATGFRSAGMSPLPQGGPDSASVPVSAPVSVPVAVVPPSIPVPAPSLGTIVPPAAARHHRIWIDGAVVDPSRGAGLRVPCGTHVVRIGSGGASQLVDVPCGGYVTLGAD
jgi:serine/threonine-protein kinase